MFAIIGISYVASALGFYWGLVRTAPVIETVEFQVVEGGQEQAEIVQLFPETVSERKVA